ncbi:MAG: cupin domain-containing protein [Pseudomonadota bacterium]
MSTKDKGSALIEQLGLQPHPEGGWFRETWRGPARDDGRATGTAIVFALKSGERSHWHRVDADELWIWQGGDALTLRVASGDAGPVETVMLGGDFSSGEALQKLVPKGAWQAADAPLDGAGVDGRGKHGYSLVSCVVVPGFEFAGFKLAPQGWEPG